MQFTYQPGATPIDPDEAAGLIPTHLTLQSQLNLWEETNIRDAVDWIADEASMDVLSIDYIRGLHKAMFGRTWKWAGQFRMTDKNIGISKHRIQEELRKLCDDAKFWIANKTYPELEVAVRLHHRLTQIHPFPNGNGRHARLMADLLMIQFGQVPLTWGRINLTAPGEARAKYIEALHAADRHDVKPLIDFATA